jgi:hypothetical protein
VHEVEHHEGHEGHNKEVLHHFVREEGEEEEGCGGGWC